MNPWSCENWKNFYSGRYIPQTGLRLRFDKGVDRTLRLVFLDLSAWLRRKYAFPIRVNAYIKNSPTIKAMDGEAVSATFFGPYDRLLAPYIRIAAGDFADFTDEAGMFQAVCGEIASLVHELTHYYQWLNALDLTEKQSEKQANLYRERIVYNYLNDRGYDFMESVGISV